MNEIHQHTLRNGLTIVAEPVASARSLAMTILTPAGISTQAADRQGTAALMEEMVCRGAGDLDARAHSDALDFLGVQRGTSAETTHFRVNATMIGSKLADALPLVADMVVRPQLCRETLEPSRDLAIQAIDGLEDEPAQKVFIELRKRHYPQPFGRSPLGEKDHLQKIALDDVIEYHRQRFVPGGSIVGFAGDLDIEQLKDMCEQSFGQWQGSADELTATDQPPRGHVHENADTAQVHIGLAYDALPETHRDSILQRAANAVLSGGMSGRLFTEVREKRGLCYAVYSSYVGQKHRGIMLCYAGTTAPRAQETLDVMVAELKRLSDGIEPDEFERAIVGMKSRIVMSGESTAARAGACAWDQYVYGQPRTLDQYTAEVDAITLDRLNEFVAANRPEDMTIVTIGPNELTANG